MYARTLTNPYHEQNETVLKVGMKKHLDSYGKPKLLEMLKQVAQRMVNAIDSVFTPVPPYESMDSGNDQFPVYRAHLHDATGVAVYDDGKVISFIPTRKMIKTQNYDGKTVIGPVEIHKAIDAGVKTFSKGLWIVLFSAVPYAYDVNNYGSPQGRGSGYFDVLSDDFFQDILMGLEAINL